MTHSAGMCFVSHDHPPYEDLAWIIDKNGELLQETGWGHVVDAHHAAVNPIEGPVHIVWVEEFSDRAKYAIHELARQHRDKYLGCLVECDPWTSAVADWLRSGMPLPDEWSTEKDEEDV